MIAGFYRGQAAAGRVEGLVDLGDLLYWDNPQAARVAYQEAVDAGHVPALLGLAKVLNAVIGDQDAAVAVYQRAVSSGDPDVAAEAMYELALQARHQDEDAARALLEQVIATGHPEWAGAAMVGLARLQDGDPAAMEALYRRAMATGSDDWSGHAAIALAGLLKRRGDVAGATAALRPLIDTGNTAWAGHAALDLGGAPGGHRRRRRGECGCLPSPKRSPTRWRYRLRTGRPGSARLSWCCAIRVRGAADPTRRR